MSMLTFSQSLVRSLPWYGSRLHFALLQCHFQAFERSKALAWGGPGRGHQLLQQRHAYGSFGRLSGRYSCFRWSSLIALVDSW